MRIYVTKDNNLAVLQPDLAKEWHPTKNGRLTPSDVSSRSNKKAWWKCEQNHEWLSIINSRFKGSGCPKCYALIRGEKVRRAALRRSGSLADTYPEIAQQWHPSKNRDLKPENFTAGSGKKIWWICSRNHSWQVTIEERTRGHGCPYCSPQTSKLELRFYTELKAVLGDVRWRAKVDGLECDILLSEYDYAVELDGYPWHSGHEERDRQKEARLLRAGVRVLRIRDSRLPMISGANISYDKQEVGDEKSIGVLMQAMSTLKANLALTKDDESKITQYLRKKEFCNDIEYKKMVVALPGPPFEDSVANLYPRLMEEWDADQNAPLTPQMFYPGSHYHAYWKCKRGHEWRAVLKDRVAGHSCPYCSSRLVGKDNNLAIKNPHLAKQWHPTKNLDLLAKDVMPRSNRIVWWACERGHEWRAPINNRNSSTNPTGCPHCAGLRVSLNYNLAKVYPDLAKEWHPNKNGNLTPSEVLPGGKTKVWWRCENGHEWEASIGNRAKPHGNRLKGSSCPKCSYKERGLSRRMTALAKSGSLAEKHPEIARDLHLSKNVGLTASQVTSGSHDKLWWLCDNGHIRQTAVYQRVSTQGCPECH